MAFEFLKGMHAPGLGLLTVTTGAKSAEALLGRYFPEDSFGRWTAHAKRVWKSETPFRIIGVPSDSGGGICRGAAHGPLHLRKTFYTRHPSWAKGDLGDVPCIPQLVHDSMLAPAQHKRSAMALWNKAALSLPVSPLSILEETLAQAWADDPFFRPLILGGDHSVSGPAFLAMKRAGLSKKLAVLHFDAHADLMETRFGVEHCFATWGSYSIKTLGEPSAWVQVGLRNMRRPKSFYEKKFGVTQFTAQDVRRQSARAFADRLIWNWQRLGCTHLYVTNDIDGTDEQLAPSTGTPEAGGLSQKWVRDVIRYVSSAIPLVGADVTEVAPVLGSPAAARKTLRCALSYVEALKWI